MSWTKKPLVLTLFSAIIIIALIFFFIPSSPQKAPVIKVPVVTLKASLPSAKYFYGTVNALDSVENKFSTWNEYTAGYIKTTRPVGTPVMSKQTDMAGNFVNVDSKLAQIDGAPYKNMLRAAKATKKHALAQLKNAETEYIRYKKLQKSGAVSKQLFDEMEKNYYSAKANYIEAENQELIAKVNLAACHLGSAYNGIVDKTPLLPGTLTDIYHSMMTVKIMSPIGIDIKLNKTLAKRICNQDLIKVYPLNSDKPVSTFNELSHVTNDGLRTVVDNYLIPINAPKESGKYPVIEGYWGPSLYVSRFNSMLEKKTPLAVPVQSLHKDNKGYYVWRGKGQKVFQPNSLIANKFQVEKVYVEAGKLKTLINGVSTEYQVLKNPGKLKEYDFLLGRIPKGLKNNQTVVFKKYRFLFNPGEKVKIEIPALIKKGFYVPKAVVIFRGSDDSYVYVVKNNKAILTKVKLVGRDGTSYRIKGEQIKPGTRIVLLNNELKKYIKDNLPINTENIVYSNAPTKAPVDVAITKLKTETPKIYFKGKIKSLGVAKTTFSTTIYETYGYIESTVPPGAIVMGKVTDQTGKTVNSDSYVAKIEDLTYSYKLKAAKANVEAAKVKLENEKIRYERYSKLLKTDSVSRKTFDNVKASYQEAKADHDKSIALFLNAKINLSLVNVTVGYPGVVDKVIQPPGTVSSIDYPIVKLKTMSPMRLDIKLNKLLAEKVYKQAPIRVYSADSEKPLGVLDGLNTLTADGLSVIVDNYLKPINVNGADNKYPVIKSYWGPQLYVSRFNTLLNDKTPLAVSVQSIRKDDKGYYVWRGKGQKVFQPNSRIADKFQVEKVYIEPGDQTTVINGVCTEYQVLKNPGTLKEYDYILGARIPEGLKNNQTVLFQKYKFLFNPGDDIKIEIPDLGKPGFYVPASAVLSKGTDDNYVYTVRDNKAFLTKVKLTGGNNVYYRIEGNALGEGTKIVLLDKKTKALISNDSSVDIKTVKNLFATPQKIVDVSVMQVKNINPAHKYFYGKIKSLGTSILKFTTCSESYGRVKSVSPLGIPIMGRVKNLNGKTIAHDPSEAAKIEDDVYSYVSKSKAAAKEKAKAELKDAKITYGAVKRLIKSNSISQEIFDDVEETYFASTAAYHAAIANLLIAKRNVDFCSIKASYPGIVDAVGVYPGSWDKIYYNLLSLKTMCPIGVDIKLNKSLARDVYNEYPINIYPLNSDKPVGVLNGSDRLTDFGVHAIVDNYLRPVNNFNNENKYPVIESYWGPQLYVSRFFTLLDKKKPLAVPVQSLRKDDKGYYVWRGKGQKVFQPNAVIADKFQIEKVYVVPGKLKTLVNGVATEYQVLKDPGTLQEYDYILGGRIPAGMKNNQTVLFKRYKFLFNPGEKIRVEIPALTGPGFYVPASAIINRGLNKDYVYIAKDNRAILTNVKLTGTDGKNYRIAGKDIKAGTKIVLLDKSVNGTIADESPIKIKSTIDPFVKSHKIIDVSVTKLKIDTPPQKSFFTKIEATGSAGKKFSTWDSWYGQVASTRPVGTPVMSRITGGNGKLLSISKVAEIERKEYDLKLEIAEGNMSIAAVALKNAKIKYNRYKKLSQTGSVSKKKFIDSEAAYHAADADYNNAAALLLNARKSVEQCLVKSFYPGVIERIKSYPGSWSSIDHEILFVKLVVPMQIDIKLNRLIARNVCKESPIKVYPLNSDKPVGVLNGLDRLTKTGVRALVDNYLIPINDVNNGEKYPVIESYWGAPFYVSRFNVLFKKNTPLAVPVQSLRKDNKGYYVWRGKGQKVFNPNSVIATKFQIEKVYVKPGKLKTLINGVCTKYQALDNPGSLKEHDFILGSNIPKGLKNNQTVVLRRHKLLFTPGVKVRVEIPDLFKPGFYVPASSIISRGTGDNYVYVAKDNKALLVKVKLTGGNNKYYRIEAKELEAGTEVVLLNKETKTSLFNDSPLKIKSVVALFVAPKAAVNVSAFKIEKFTPPTKYLYGEVKALDVANNPFTDWQHRYGYVRTTLPVGASVASKVTNEKGETVGTSARMATVHKKAFVNQLRGMVDSEKAALAHLENAKQSYKRYKRVEKSISKESLDDAEATYKKAEAAYRQAKARTLNARVTLNLCNIEAAYAGVVNNISLLPGGWSTSGHNIVTTKTMSPIGIDIKLNKLLAYKIYNKYPIRVYPLNSDKPVGALNELDRLTGSGIRALVDNYLVPVNNTNNPNKYPVIEGYWGSSLYVSRFYPLLDKKTPLAVPMQSLHKDNKGYYVWRGKGQKVFNPNSMIADKFEVEKVYVVPGNLKTLIDGVCAEYRVLKDSGKLQEYDFILGKRVPKGLKNNQTVLYKKHDFLFSPGEKVRVEIPDLVKPGFYVPITSVVTKGTADNYVYIVKNNGAILSKVKIDGIYDKYYLITGQDISAGTRIVLLDEKTKSRISNGSPLKIKSTINLTTNKNEPINISNTILLKQTASPEKYFYGASNCLEVGTIQFTTWKHKLGHVASTLPENFPVMARVVDLNDNVVGKASQVATIDDRVHKYTLMIAKGGVRQAKAKLDNARSEYARNKKLIKTNTVSKEDYDLARANYLTAVADYDAAKSQELIAKANVALCSTNTVYAGLTGKVMAHPGSWTNADWPIMAFKVMTPMGIDIKMSKTLFNKVYNRLPIKVYPIDSEKPVGVLNEITYATKDGIRALVDNYLVPINNLTNSGNNPVVESYWNPPLYVARFNSLLRNEGALAVPVQSLRKDDKGYYVWRGKGQKIFQLNSVLADKFQMEKVYVKPGELKTFMAGVCTEYRVLKDAGSLKEYDFLLGATIPKGLKNNQTVLFNKYRFLFHPGEQLRVEIPGLNKKGFYVPTSFVISKGTNDNYVYIIENGTPLLTKVKITGGNNDYYRIEGKEIKEGAKVALLDRG